MEVSSLRQESFLLVGLEFAAAIFVATVVAAEAATHA